MELNSTDLKWLEDKFKRYNSLDREIAIRKEEVKLREPDNNIGGGKVNFISLPVESQVIREMSDPLKGNFWNRSLEILDTYY